MPAAAFSCPRCKAPLGIEADTTEVAATCPQCGASIEAYFFPAFYRPPTVGVAPASLTDATEASCFNHPQKQAIRVCDGCGRLICALCSIEMGAEHLCPSCISSGRKKGKITTLENTRTRYDSMALSLAVAGMFVYCLAIAFCPAAIYVAIKHWNSPGSLLGVSKARFILAIVIALAGILFWIAIFSVMIFHARK